MLSETSFLSEPTTTSSKNLILNHLLLVFESLLNFRLEFVQRDVCIGCVTPHHLLRCHMLSWSGQRREEIWCRHLERRTRNVYGSLRWRDGSVSQLDHQQQSLLACVWFIMLLARVNFSLCIQCVRGSFECQQDFVWALLTDLLLLRFLFFFASWCHRDTGHVTLVLVLSHLLIALTTSLKKKKVKSLLCFGY